MILDRTAPNRKPVFGSVTLTRGHSLARNLDLALLLNEGAGDAIDLIRGFRVLRSGAFWMAQGLQFTLVSDVLTLANYTFASVGSVVIKARLGFAFNDGITHGMWGISADTSTVAFKFNDNNWYLRVGSGGFLIVPASAANVLQNIPAVYAWTWTQSACAFYVNGILQGTGGGQNASGSQTLNIGSAAGNGIANAAIPSYIDEALIWSGRSLTQAEVLALTAEPYAFLTPKAPRLWMLGAPPSSTLQSLSRKDRTSIEWGAQARRKELVPVDWTSPVPPPPTPKTIFSFNVELSIVESRNVMLSTVEKVTTQIILGETFKVATDR